MWLAARPVLFLASPTRSLTVSTFHLYRWGYYLARHCGSEGGAPEVELAKGLSQMLRAQGSIEVKYKKGLIISL